MHELRLALQVDAALQVDVLGSAPEIEELNPLARSRPVDCCPERTRGILASGKKNLDATGTLSGRE